MMLVKLVAITRITRGADITVDLVGKVDWLDGTSWHPTTFQVKGVEVVEGFGHLFSFSSLHICRLTQVANLP